MKRKTVERQVFDKAIDDLKPFLPFDYGARVRAKGIDIPLERLHLAVRKRGLEPDWTAYQALMQVKEKEPVLKKERKPHKPRSQRQQLQAA